MLFDAVQYIRSSSSDRRVLSVMSELIVVALPAPFDPFLQLLFMFSHPGQAPLVRSKPNRGPPPFFAAENAFCRPCLTGLILCVLQAYR